MRFLSQFKQLVCDTQIRVFLSCMRSANREKHGYEQEHRLAYNKRRNSKNYKNDTAYKKSSLFARVFDGLLTLVDRGCEGIAAFFVGLVRGVLLIVWWGVKGMFSLLFLLLRTMWRPIPWIFRRMTGRYNCASRCLRLTGIEFEEYMGQVLRDNGFRHVEVTEPCGDQGADILAVRNGKTYAIQCKNYTNAVGNAAVQEACAAAQYYGCDEAVVVCPGEFTIPAQELAEATGVILWDGEHLSHMMRVSGRRPHHDPRRTEN